MRILIIRSYCPAKIFYGGDMRVSRFIDYFSRFSRLDLLTLLKPHEVSDLDAVKRAFANYYYFESFVQKPSFLSRMVYALPWQLTQFYSFENQDRLRGIIEENRYDFIFVSKLEPLLYLLRLPKKWHDRIIIDFDDILSDLFRNHYTNFFTSRKNSFFLKFNENKALKYFRRVFVCSSGALNKINGKYRHKVGIVPNVYPYAEKAFPPSPDKGRLLFVGSLDYFPNTEGLHWFFKTIWPQVKQIYPDLKLTVVGKAQRDALSCYASFCRPQDVEITVNAPSVVPHYQNCFASIVPILNGSGTRLKILESAAFGRPVISTEKGMEGLDFEDDRQILLFKDADSFIHAYKKLLEHKTYDNIVSGALNVLKNSYSQDAFQKSMDENWQTIMKAL